VIFCAYTLAHPEAVALLAGAGFPCLTSMPNAARTLSAMADYQRFLQRRCRDGDEVAAPFTIPAEVDARLAACGGILCEYQAKSLLAELGLADNHDVLASSEQQAVAAAARLGCAVALKVQSPDISHRSQAGAVALGVHSDEAVAAAYRTILENARRHHPDADIHGVSISPMGEPGVEIILGISRDTDFGAMVVLGAGGTLVEVLDDVIVTPAPASRAQVLDLLGEWKGKRLLDGSAGLPPADIDALVELTVMVSRFAAAAENLASLDLNPVLVHPRGQGVSVVDALIITDRHPGSGHSPLTADPTTESVTHG
jgi:succinyl-CoA synthetase beta subunit